MVEFLCILTLLYYTSLILFEICFETNLDSRNIYLSSESLVSYNGFLIHLVELFLWLTTFTYILFSIQKIKLKNENDFIIIRLISILLIIYNIITMLFVIDSYRIYQNHSSIFKPPSTINYASHTYNKFPKNTLIT